MTFCAIARDKTTGDFGGAVASKLLRVGALVVHLDANYGAFATMNCRTKPFRYNYGSEGTRMLRDGLSSVEVLNNLLAADDNAEEMEISVIDNRGSAAARTGSKMPPSCGHIIGDNFIVQGNMLASGDVLKSMYEACSVEAPLAERLLRALEAGEQAGGDKRGKQSAGLRVVREFGGPRSLSDKLVDLRVDDHPEPIKELHRLLLLHNESTMQLKE